MRPVFCFETALHTPVRVRRGSANPRTSLEIAGVRRTREMGESGFKGWCREGHSKHKLTIRNETGDTSMPCRAAAVC
jgi:hypothetical protein